jgi:type VI secretion system secreted protein VgrG
MGKLDQASRVAALRTPFDTNVLVLKSFSGTEGLSEPFEFHIDALSEQANLDFNNALGQPCSIKLKTYEQKERFFCGILTRAQWAGNGGGGEQPFSQYSLVLRPWFWLLTHSANCRIFPPDQTVKEIIEKVFNDLGFHSGTHYKFRTTANYDTIKYCVQYRESDFAFVSRLMEQYGIYYYFEHGDMQHTMVLADSRSSHSAIPELPQVNYHTQSTRYTRAEQQIDSWVSDRQFCTGIFALNDYDYLHPTKTMRASKETSERYVRALSEVYDYPGKYDEPDGKFDEQKRGEQFAQFRMEAEQALDRRRNATGEAPSLFAGGLVTLNRHPTSDENKEYLVVRASHTFGIQSYGAVGEGDGAASYHGSYQFLRSDHPFRMLALTPKPRIHGIQTAMVVAKDGEEKEEISTDEHGRIWVQFYWDREPKKSCPIRVSQSWASKQWGGQFIPRIGMEVVVEFLEGDPDRPLVTGCVYNGDNKHPYKLPDLKTQSGLKSDSTKGHNGYNEFMFEDWKGHEVIRMHAQRNHDVTVLESETWNIGKDRSATVQRDDMLMVVKGDRSVYVNHGHQYTTVAKEINAASQEAVTQTVNGVTTIKLTTDKILMQAPSSITLTAGLISIIGNVQITGSLSVLGVATVGGRPV